MKTGAGVYDAGLFIFWRRVSVRQPVAMNSQFQKNQYHYQVSQPIIFKRGTSLATLVLWLMDALPAVLAGVMFYPLCRMYDVDFDRPFGVLSILAATLTLAVVPPRNHTSEVLQGRLELATNLLLRWAVLVAVLLALGYMTKSSEVYSRRVVVTWILVTPVLLVVLSLVLQSLTRAILKDSAQARRAIVVGCTAGSLELTRRLARHNELGISVAGFFDDRGSDRLQCADHAQLLGRFNDVASFVNSRNIDMIFIAIPPGQVARMRDLLNELGDTTASVYYVPDVSGFDMIQQRTSEILGFPVVAMCETPFHGYRGLVKRLMDVTLASLGLVALMPLLLGIAIAVRRSS